MAAGRASMAAAGSDVGPNALINYVRPVIIYSGTQHSGIDARDRQSDRLTAGTVNLR